MFKRGISKGSALKDSVALPPPPRSAHQPATRRRYWAAAFCAVVAAALVPLPAAAQNCPDAGDAPTPTAVTVNVVPIVVVSTTAEYFVLYVSHELDADTTLELPVLVKKGDADTTTLTENVEPLPVERYRVEKYQIADPADIDGDCIDDITELDNLGTMNPINPAAVDVSDGTVALSNRAAWEAIAIDNHYLKFILADMDTDRPSVYFLDYDTHPGHDSLLTALEVERDQPGLFKGDILWRSKLLSDDLANKQGIYYFNLTSYDSGNYTFAAAARAHSVLAASMSFIENNLAFHIPNQGLWHYQDELPLFRESRIDLVFDEDIRTKKKFVPLNETVGFGLLRVMDPEERPSPRDVVVYESLPNDLPRVAGIISTVPQTPLSHVNLRALQDGVPNAYVRDARTHPTISDLIGKYVRYEVTDSEWKMRAATLAEVDAHYASSRPTAVQFPERDLSVKSITALDDIGFDDWDAFGVKAANVAVLGGLRLPEGTVPDGFAIPFYFYDEFMKHNGFYGDIVNMLADEDFQSDFDTQVSQLKSLRKEIEDAETPQWIIDALVKMNESFEDGVHRRYRSSTNNEDLPSFNGAGLYDSKSQKPSEDEEDLAKSLKEVYASLWNYRAFSERDFYRVDHLTTAMGVLVHPSYRDEKVNGVAVSFAVVYGDTSYYYVNSQIDEDLVTNPEALSIPEEILLRPRGKHVMIRTSNQVEPGELLLTTDQMALLRSHLSAIHNKFKELYGPADGEPFAMEIEFKITADDVLAIKQARPWVFHSSPTVTDPVVPDPVVPDPVVPDPVVPDPVVPDPVVPDPVVPDPVVPDPVVPDPVVPDPVVPDPVVPDPVVPDPVEGGSSSRDSGAAGGMAVLVVANGWSPSDVGVAAALSARIEGSAVVYTTADRLSVATAELVERYQPGEVIVVGGETVVGAGVQAEIERLSGGGDVVRVRGGSRVVTAANAARRVLGDPVAGTATVVVANGWSPSDIGVAAAVAARTEGSAVLYSEPGVLPDAAVAVLAAHRPRRVIVIGGPSAVPPAVEAGIRIAGGGRGHRAARRRVACGDCCERGASGSGRSGCGHGDGGRREWVESV